MNISAEAQAMKAIRVREFGGPEVLHIEDVDLPQPANDEVVVRVKAAGVNPYDTYMRAGSYGVRNPALPYTPGSDAAGTIEFVGPANQHWEVGARVYTTGTVTGAYAELPLCKMDQVHRLPAHVTYSQGAALYVPYATAYRALFQLARAKPGETVLIHGASGGVGIAATQWARAVGLRVIGTAGSDRGLQLVADQGASYSFNHHSPEYRQRILDVTEGRGVDVIVEMLANVNLAHDVRLLAHRGRIVIVGSRGDAQLTPRDLFSREGTILGVLLWAVPVRDAGEIYAAIDAGLRSNALLPVVGSELPLADAATSHRRLMESGAFGKIVLIP